MATAGAFPGVRGEAALMEVGTGNPFGDRFTSKNIDECLKS